MPIRALLAVAASLGTAAVFAPLAAGHGDPASDVLAVHALYFPYAGGTVSGSNRAALSSVVREANAKGMKIRVAVIGGPLDLGPVARLWNKPTAYARFLGRELKFNYADGLVLTVMPNGFGLYRGTHAQQNIVEHIRTGKSADELVQAATTAVEQLGTARGIKLAPHVSKSGSASSDRLVIILLGVALLAVLALVSYLRLQRPARETSASHE